MQGDDASAGALLVKMEVDLGVAPDTTSFNTVLRAIAKGARPDVVKVNACL